jgi:hypothetical protein
MRVELEPMRLARNWPARLRMMLLASDVEVWSMVMVVLGLLVLQSHTFCPPLEIDLARRNLVVVICVL